MVSLVYHRQLDEAWEVEARKLRSRLAEAPTAQAAGQVPYVLGRSHKQKVGPGSMVWGLGPGSRVYGLGCRAWVRGNCWRVAAAYWRVPVPP